MTLVDDAFLSLKSNLEITPTEQTLASNRHNAIRDVVRSAWSLEADFLTGSYRRDTKTKKLRDVDIFVVIDPDGPQSGLRNQSPAAVLRNLQIVLQERYSRVTPDVFACVVEFGPEEDVTSFDVVPAYLEREDVYLIPDTSSGRWISTNPKKHHEATTSKNKETDGKWVPLVKMLKGANRHAGDPISPSFLIEVMALELVRTPIVSYQQEFALFCASAAATGARDWPDPAGLGPAVNRALDANARTMLCNTFRAWQLIAETAIDLEADGSHRAAIAEWKKLFGSRMPQL